MSIFAPRSKTPNLIELDVIANEERTTSESTNNLAPVIAKWKITGLVDGPLFKTPIFQVGSHLKAEGKVNSGAGSWFVFFLQSNDDITRQSSAGGAVLDNGAVFETGFDIEGQSSFLSQPGFTEGFIYVVFRANGVGTNITVRNILARTLLILPPGASIERLL